ncbi:hypothetical protein GGS23DRAFT_273110 [Durotheca rogersii]|uniref:uncharacterized protein n=1 Tax=Durotheca rogersii TaxID=419775 RepID=UPI00221EA152|nr:uncharacterized protein GGS23DRAFT_273110 [Durotheca rogersii]KAI5866471.1 hypothetical protein GGS23DRAFT_273110 [Durotheca rogersii]
MQAPQPGDQLEGRLRSLILNNAENSPRALPTPIVSNPTEGRPVGGQSAAKGGWQNTNQAPAATQPNPKASKKRPNQAQRRQMQTQLSIPIDLRAPEHNDAGSSSATYQHRRQRSAWQSPEQNALRPNPGSHRGGSQGRSATTNNRPFPLPRRHNSEAGQASSSIPSHHAPWRHQQPPNPDARGVSTAPAEPFPPRRHRPSQSVLYNPGGQRPLTFSQEQLANQSGLLDRLCHTVLSDAEIGPGEIAEKEDFRAHVEAICREIISRYEMEANGNLEFQPQSVQLKCFGSLSSGFATKAADMDLGLLSPMSRSPPDAFDSPIPRLIEKALLDHGFGARLLTRTRVPIIKLCEKPTQALRQALLGARVKWEKGLDDDTHEAADDALDDQEAPTGTSAAVVTKAEHPSPSKQQDSLQHPSDDTVVKTYEEQLALLRQSENQSLTTFYNIAKRLLRRLNGRDVTISNAADFKPADYEILNDVCSAFINGLSDKSLKSRVQSIPSLFVDSPLPNLRSLQGVFMIIEGEKHVILWETQAMAEDRQRDSAVIQAWKDLQTKRTFGTDPVRFNRDLHLALQRLRQVPLVQLVQFKQDQYESPTQYHQRAAKIMTDLGSNPSLNTDLSTHITRQYILGIRDPNIREKVQDFTSSVGQPTLKTIARKHKAVHLAAEYERAVEKDFYNREDHPVIRQYIQILRGELLQQVPNVHGYVIDEPAFHVPVAGDTMEILEKIKQLPDPSQLTPNQPRDRYHDKLEFSKSGIGVQCDINFSAHLALQNTLLLRCYSYSDPRVRPMVLFVKHWAKARGINTPYRGTLSSYGYVLMVLHYLVNVVDPFVCPNLQQLAPPDPDLPAEALEGLTTCQGRDVRFWRDEQEIQRLAIQGRLNQNGESLGFLLRGFFEYYAQSSMMSTAPRRGFDWGRDVLSLRTHGGLLSKQEKGWIGAKTVMQPQTGAPPNPAEAELASASSHAPADGASAQQQPPHPADGGAPATPTGQPPRPAELKEVRHRFLFAIEDPFELEHNVARTVTHNGIVAIRDEFRRAWRIVKHAGKTGHAAEDLLQDAQEESSRVERLRFEELLAEIHGPHVFPDLAPNRLES